MIRGSNFILVLHHNYGRNISRGATSKTKAATVIPPQRKHVTTMIYQAVASTAKNMKDKSKVTPTDHGATSKTNGTTVIPPQRKHVTTMMFQRNVKAVASTSKNMKDKIKITPADYGVKEASLTPWC
ncbi:hypothetical protein CTI12_AA298440 [Artemisia annua]|uniref:Uncharacterized protein n=1 Tax=Artemisia annua TaxID=35608 RepID=A0A2U1N7D7_ARTAN|nr:hypothetical protein CTI12_AA298440 [Artemisia annua]